MDPYRQVQPYLRAEEKLLWYGSPDPRVWFTPADVYVVPFSVLWCGFAIFWEFTVMRGGPVFFQLWGIPFVALGLYFVIGRFFFKNYNKRRTAYAITSRRAMVVGPRSLVDQPLLNQPITVRRSRDTRHASVVIGNTVVPAQGPGLGPGRRRRSAAAQYPNTGMELLSRNASLPFAFYDVANPDAMLQALDHARSNQPELDR